MNVLVVDDEPLVLRGIARMLRVEEGVRNVLMASDGFEALRLLQDNPIDLVTTDISMPEMDGLELIKRAREKKLSKHFLIISSYADFQYAKTAIELGAFRYLLNPIDRKELHEAIADMKELLEHDRQKEQEVFIERIRELIIYGHLSEELNLSQYADYFRLLLLDADSPVARDRLMAHLNNAHSALFIPAEGKQMLFLLKVDQSMPDSELTARISDIAQLNRDRIYVSKITDKAEELPLLYKEILYNAKSLDADGKLSAELAINLDLQDRSRFQNYLNEINSAAQKNTGFTATYLILLTALAVKFPIYDNEIVQSYKKLMQRNRTGERQQKVLNTVLRAVLFNKSLSAKQLKSIRRIMQMVLDNYYKPDITLNMIADRLDMHPNYISNIFSNELKVHFVKYLNTLRIVRAQELLMHRPHLSVQTVAEQCGFENTNHFHRVFKSYTAMTPGEFKYLNRKGE